MAINSNLSFSYLVPLDFTERSEQALHYTAEIVKKYDGLIRLLHVVDERNGFNDDKLLAIKQKTTEYAREKQDALNITVIPNMVMGNIFVSIGEAAKKLGAHLIIMGTHGIQGIQFIIGSFAARVILGSPVPVLITNGKKHFSGFKNIVLPFDMSVDMQHLVSKTIEMGKLYNSTVHLFLKNENKGLWKRKNIELKARNILKKIRKAGLTCQLISLENKDQSYIDSVIDYADSIDADMIMITARSRHNSSEYIIIENGVRLMEKARTPLLFFQQKQ